MDGALQYHSTISLISKLAIFKVRREHGGGVFSDVFLKHFGASVVWVSGGRGLDSRLRRDAYETRKGRVRLLVPSAEFWNAENDGDFVRGEIFMASDALPPLSACIGECELRVLWNYARVVPASSEAWVRTSLCSPAPKFLVQSTNRIAGSEYLIVRANNAGMVQLISEFFPALAFAEWKGDRDGVDEAATDAGTHWKSKWFVKDDAMLSESLAVASRLVRERWACMR